MRHATLHVALLVCMAAGCCNGAPAQDDDAIVFADDSKSSVDSENIITPPRLPVIEHLENDPTTFRREDKQVKHNFKDEKKTGVTPKFGFDLTPATGGGFSASFSHGFTGLGGGSQAGSHSVTLGGANNGFQVLQSSSQSSSFGAGPGFLGNSIAGSQASSQSASFGAGLNGLSSASSAASSSAFGGNLFGQDFSSSAAQSQSAANSIGLQSVSPDFGQTFSNGNAFSNGFGSTGFGGRDTGSIITFPGPVANRYPKLNYRPIPQTPPRGSLYTQSQFRRRRPSAYEWIRIEV